MPEQKNISSKTLTLIIGIIVAIFLFLSVTFFQNDTQEDLPDESKSATSESVTRIEEGAVNILSIIQKAYNKAF